MTLAIILLLLTNICTARDIQSEPKRNIYDFLDFVDKYSFENKLSPEEWVVTSVAMTRTLELKNVLKISALDTKELTKNLYVVVIYRSRNSKINDFAIIIDISSLKIIKKVILYE
ncbi:MAG: hypothetical protein A2020_03460 [Lentisphaerae bacterium GWF2_45_14]|nr:MAG: hypothetical protein A2020_03460 [Lentisphaerae bacterium GWF2_45_14]